MTKHGEPRAFLNRGAAATTNECILWPFATTSRGYGNVWFKGRNYNAHRAVLVLLTGIDPPEMEALHGPCHNRLCINGNHLSWGTQIDNATDKKRDGTHNGGEAHHQARLTEEDVKEIRRAFNSGVRQRVLADQYGVTRGHISTIVRNRSWNPQYARGSAEHGEIQQQIEIHP